MRKLLSATVLIFAVLIPAVVYYDKSVPIIFNGVLKAWTLKEKYFPTPGFEGKEKISFKSLFSRSRIILNIIISKIIQT